MKHTVQVISLIFMLFLFGCKELPRNNFIDEELMIPVPEDSLYLRMRGNPEDPILLNLHGGPGGFSEAEMFLMGPALEKNFFMIYLDQRGCGKSSFCKDAGLLNVKQYVKDLNIVVDSLRNRYGGQKLNLMGTSWGGMYGFLYLLAHQEKINAYASIDGKVNSEYQNRALIEHELKLANEALGQENTAERTAELQGIKQDLLRIRKSNLSNFYEDVNKLKHVYPEKLGFNAYYADTSKSISAADVLTDSVMLSSMHFTPKQFKATMKKAEIVNAAFRNNAEYNTLNIEQKLNKIHTPVLVVQGEEDRVVGVKQAQIIYDALKGLGQRDKELFLLPKVAHNAAMEAPDTLAVILRNFFLKHSFQRSESH